MARLDARQRQRLRQAEGWNGQVVQLQQQGKWKEALPLAEKALATRQEILGEKHPACAASAAAIRPVRDAPMVEPRNSRRFMLLMRPLPAAASGSDRCRPQPSPRSDSERSFQT